MNRYQWNVGLIEPFTRMSLWGLRYDTALAASMRAEQLPRAWAAQAQVDALAGVSLPEGTEALLAAVGHEHCHAVKLRKQLKGYAVMAPVLAPDGTPLMKKDGKPKRAKSLVPPRPLSWALLAETANLAGSSAIARIRDLAESEQTPATRAEIASLLKLSINVEAPEQVIECLDRLGLPAKFKKGKRDPDDPSAGRTSDEEALLDLFIRTGHPITKAILEARGARGALSWLDSMKTDEDGRVRCSFSNPGSECVAGDTWVFTASGWRQMEEIFNAPKLPLIWDGQEWHHPMRKVSYASRDGFEIVTECGFTLKASANHPLWTPGGWIALENLRVGSKVWVPTNLPVDSGHTALPRRDLPVLYYNAKKAEYPSGITPELCELLGMWLADGTIHDGHRSYHVRISNEELCVRERWVELSKLCFGLPACSYENTATLNGHAATNWFRVYELEGLASQKKVPAWLMKADLPCIRGLLRGLTLDTHFTDHGLVYGTQSIVMRQQIQLLLQRLGIIASATPSRLVISKPQIGQFLFEVGFAQNRKAIEAATLLNKPHNGWVRHGAAGRWVEIKEMRPWRGTVYDLTMPKNPAYIANGLYVHNTGRVLTRAWHSGSGGNLQAVSKEPINFRKLLRADPGCLLAQCDLKGADGWTVAARCAQHGDLTMLLDLKAGIRIPSLLALLMGGAVFPTSFDRTELRKLCKAVVKDWRDFAYKVGQHGSNYMGSANLIRTSTVKESWFATGVPIDPGVEFCKRIQACYLGRYWGLRSWWSDCERQVRRTGTLEAASGQVREFLSRRWTGEGANKRLDRSTHKEVVAHEPQSVTTFVTNLALWRLWSDPQNWPEGHVGNPFATPYVQPLLHGHDAIVVQFREEHTAAAGRKLAEWFSNDIRIGSLVVRIPVEMAYGPSWGECDQPFPP